MRDADVFVDDEDYPFLSWAEDHAIMADPLCPDCTGDGWRDGAPCTCLVEEAFAVFPAAADAAEPDPGCVVCDADGETRDGHVCLCRVPAFRAAQEDSEG